MPAQRGGGGTLREVRGVEGRGGGLAMAAAGFMARKNRSLGEREQLNIILSPAPAEATFKCASVQSSDVITREEKRKKTDN